ncbi:uncharacterized protein STEHIDRAFT_161746 [Stereum hirsutum FP-91666 SS1]|uniref:uncharacterized protein n=1 Tax=Stereum hirsutum (strain FP-91666) TaxID=721885 RepID=UPI0004449C29|nr:uncharacterized protein STEHIDRAFT_161746 [Stereum hirsutum FP-91666 SS1]EIM81567.1 hypothetical protein STEHIDRAFT_161746 [Stereum hirsutum FP-91666 SS1]
MSTVSSITKRKVGPFAMQDTGAPAGRSNYQTLVIIHGATSPGDIFSRLVPFASQSNARIVLVNRRDYPGSTPYSDAEQQLLASCLSDTAEAAKNIRSYMKDRACELYDFLCEFAMSENIPMISGEGGMTVVGWSLGGNWITALLAYLEIFEGVEMTLRSYLNKLILLDPPYSVLGFPHHEDLRMPIDDATVTDGKAVIAWLTGFFDHSIPPSFPSTPILDPELRLGRTPVSIPPPTIATISPEEIQNVIFIPPAAPGGSDVLLYEAGQRLGLFEEMRKKALYATAEEDVTAEQKGWRESVEVKVIWCDRSIWGVPWGISQLYREVEDAKAKGELSVGRVNIVRVTGANHYIHWEEPERALRALLAGSTQEA